MSDKNNINVLYILVAAFIFYVFVMKAKETLENTGEDTRNLNDLTEEELRLTINRALRSKERLEYFDKMSEKTEYIKKRIGELYYDIKRGDDAKGVLVSRGIFT